MALHFNCEQYEDAFWPKKLQNWEAPKYHRRRPLTQEGYTQIIANNRGHLLPSMPRSSRSPWGTFVGTWDLPNKLPGNKQFDPTARSADAHMRQMSSKKEADDVIHGRTKYRRAKAGQPMEAMTADCDPASMMPQRSGAANPLVKGTPNRGTPVKTFSATDFMPLDTNQNAAHIEDTIANELRYSPNRASPNNAAGRISAARRSPAYNQGTPKAYSPLPNINTQRDEVQSPKAATPKPSSPMRSASGNNVRPMSSQRPASGDPIPVV